MTTTRYALGMTRFGEAQHVVPIREDGRAEPKSLCGQKITYAHSVGFPKVGEPVQHPWRCDKCSRKIEATS